MFTVLANYFHNYLIPQILYLDSLYSIIPSLCTAKVDPGWPGTWGKCPLPKLISVNKSDIKRLSYT